MDYYISRIKKWIPPLTKEDKELFHRILSSTEQTFGAFFLKRYASMIKPYIGLISRSSEPNCLASGAIFFFGCLIYVMHYPNWGKHIEDILLYNLLYILVDNYIDDASTKQESKQESIKNMKLLLENPEKDFGLTDPMLVTLLEIYRKMLERHPSVKNSLKQVFLAEVEGLKVQNSKNLTRQEYLNIAIKKGARSIFVLQDIVDDHSPENTKESELWGVILQLVDDSADVDEDVVNNIHTVATHDLKTTGNLDNLWCHVAELLDKTEKFKIFKILFAIISAYLPSKYAKNYSKELTAKLSEFNLFEGFDTTAMVREIIDDELDILDLLASTSKESASIQNFAQLSSAHALRLETLTSPLVDCRDTNGSGYLEGDIFPFV